MAKKAFSGRTKKKGNILHYDFVSIVNIIIYVGVKQYRVWKPIEFFVKTELRRRKTTDRPIKYEKIFVVRTVNLCSTANKYIYIFIFFVTL